MYAVKPLCRRISTPVIVAAWAASHACAVAQEVLPEAPKPGRLSTAHPDVYVDDSFEADESIARAVEWGQQQRWSEAVVLLNRVVDQHGDKLTHLERDRFINVIEKVNRVITSWPPEGVAAYQRLVNEQSAAALESARTAHRLDRLLDIADRYFCTPAGAEAADLGAQVAIEAGDFDIAVGQYRRLIDRHPDRDRLQSLWLARLAVAYALSNQADLARATAQQAGDAAAMAWMGQQRRVVDLVPELIGHIHPQAQPDPSLTWPTFGGSYARDAAAGLAIDELAMLWSVPDVGEASITPPSDRSSSFRRALSKGRMLSMHPVFDGAVVYMQDTARVWAFNLNSGKMLWSFSGVGEITGQSLTTDGELPHWYSPSIAGGFLYASLGSEVVPYYGYDPPEETTALVCLDVESGHEIWRADRSALGPDAKEFTFESSPIVAANNVYVIARRKRTFGFEDCFLLKFDRASGRLEFRTHLGSASTGGFGYRRPTLSIPTVYDGSVLACTNLGTFASVDMHTGRVRWMTLFDRISEANWRRDGRAASREQNPWQYNPPLLLGEWVCLMPTDSDDLIVADRENGRIVRQIPLSELSNAQTVFGADDPVIFGVGAQAFCYDVRSGSMVWTANLPEKAELFGRGLLTETEVLIPTDRFLCAFDRRDGRLTAQEWEHDLPKSGGGNLLAASGKLLVAGSDHLTAYARKHDVLANMRQRMEEQPTDPAAALELAEVLFRTGDCEGATATIDEAITRAGGAAQAMDEELRRRIFEDCMSFAESLMGKPEYEFAAVVSFFERAALSAPDAAAHVAYRFAWARCLEQNDRAAEAVAMYQQVIADRSLREIPHAVAEGVAEPAGFLAERSITDLVRQHGLAVYAEFESKAAQMYSAGRTAGDVQLLDRMIDCYPNSPLVIEALVAKGDALAASGGFFDAAVSYQRALLSSPNSPERPKLFRKIADAYAAAQRPHHAYRWLTRGARELPQAQIMVDGNPMRLLEYRDRLGFDANKVIATRPHLAPPLVSGYEQRFDESFWLLEPHYADLPQTDWGQHLIFIDDTLRAYHSATGDEAWPNPLPCPRRPELLAALAGIFVLADPFQVFAVNCETGVKTWEYGGIPPELEDPAADPEDFPRFASLDTTADQLIVIRQDGSAALLEIRTGRILWEKKLEHPPTGRVVIGDAAIAYEATDALNPIYVLLDIATGEPLRQCNPGDPRRAEHLFLTLDGRLIVVTTQTLHCFDTRTGQRLWSTERPEEIRTAAVRLDLDGLYLNAPGSRIEKLRLGDGRTIWQSEEPMDPIRPEEGALQADLAADQLLVSDERRVLALNQASGLIEWEGTLRRGARLRYRFTARDYLVALDTPGGRIEEESSVYFYDLRNASGILPTEGGVTPLGILPEVEQAMVRDGALLIKSGNMVKSWKMPEQKSTPAKSSESNP